MQCTIHVQQNERLERTIELSSTNVRKIINIGMGIIFWNTSTTFKKKNQKRRRYRLNLSLFFFFCYIRFNFEGFVSGEEVLFLFVWYIKQCSIYQLSVISYLYLLLSCSCTTWIKFAGMCPNLHVLIKVWFGIVPPIKWSFSMQRNNK